MPNRLHRYYGAGYLHFITTSCYQRRPLLCSGQSRDLFLHVLDRVRRRYHFVVAGYVVMPEHVHLLLSEPDRGDPSLVMKAVKACGPAFRVLPSRSGTVGAPSLRFLQGRVRCCLYHRFVMPSGLHRTYGAHHLHFITCSCYRRLPFLSSPRARNRFLAILEQTRQRYRFVIVGYVVMPEHIHLLVTEPEVGTPSTIMQVLKQRTARALLPKKIRKDPRQRDLFGDATSGRAFWQARFYDFNVWTTKKRFEKLRYMHRNPVKRGLVESPEQWRWSSYRFYLLGETGLVRVNQGWTEISFRDRVA